MSWADENFYWPCETGRMYIYVDKSSSTRNRSNGIQSEYTTSQGKLRCVQIFSLGFCLCFFSQVFDVFRFPRTIGSVNDTLLDRQFKYLPACLRCWRPVNPDKGFPFNYFLSRGSRSNRSNKRLARRTGWRFRSPFPISAITATTTTTSGGVIKPPRLL